MISMIFVILTGVILPVILLADVGIAIVTIPTIRLKTWKFSPIKNWFNKLPIVLSLYILALYDYSTRPLACLMPKFETKIEEYMGWDIFSFNYKFAYIFYLLIMAICIIEFFSWKDFFKKLKE